MKVNKSCAFRLYFRPERLDHDELLYGPTAAGAIPLSQPKKALIVHVAPQWVLYSIGLSDVSRRRFSSARGLSVQVLYTTLVSATRRWWAKAPQSQIDMPVDELRCSRSRIQPGGTSA